MAPEEVRRTVWRAILAGALAAILAFVLVIAVLGYVRQGQVIDKQNQEITSLKAGDKSVDQILRKAGAVSGSLLHSEHEICQALRLTC